MNSRTLKLTIWGGCLAVLAAGAWPSLAMAYIGPGLGMSAIGSFLALVGAVFLGILGFLWYPIKRLLKMFKSKPKTQDD